ncbi:MAG TPA: hypothetical protein PLP42_19045 [Acidobacteriota bacterium]|nr:hypothetical protein [Acidobacteriota bacterium]
MSKSQEGYKASMNNSDKPTSKSYLLISLVIVFFLVLQSVATSRILCPPRNVTALAPLRVCCSPAMYPFLDYPMYMKAHYPGDQMPRIRVYGIQEDSTRVRIQSQDLNLNKWLFGKFTDAVLNGETEKVKIYTDFYSRKHGTNLVALTIEIEPLIFTGQELKSGQAQVVKELSLNQAGIGDEISVYR